MYKVSSDGHQSALHRGRLTDWVNGGEDNLSGNELLRQLQDETRILQDRINNSDDKAERKALGVQRFEAQTKIAELRKLGFGKKRPNELSIIFMRLAFEMLPRVQFQIIRDAAEKELAGVVQKDAADNAAPNRL